MIPLPKFAGVPVILAAFGLLSPRVSAEQPAADWDGERGGILFEIEDYERKVPDNPEFLIPTREPAGSRRKVVARFFAKNHRAVYRFVVPEDGVYTGWLRYAAVSNQGIGVAVDPVGEPKFTLRPLPATGGLEGEGVWSWAELFQVKLDAGEHTLALASCSLRPDCVFIGTAAEEPGDDVISRDPRPLDAETRALVDKPLVPVRPTWLDGTDGYRLPDWYGRHRVHLHTRLSPRWIEKDIFFNAGKAFQEMGASVVARHIKSGGEGAWWPSEIGAILPEAENRNIAKEILNEAHRHGLRFIVYQRHMEDHHIAKEHPDWKALDWKGQPIMNRGPKICFNSPYADFFLRRTLELVDLGADGFYYDEVHMPKAGCWCGFCKEKFKAETGLDHPPEPDPYDPVWHKLIDFNNLTIERTFLKWREAIHERNPEVVMLIGSNTWPAMTKRHMTHRLFRIADSMKTEFSLPVREGNMRIFSGDSSMVPPEADARIALAYTLARDACDGRPAHIWTHGILDETSMLFAASGMIAHGCIANLDVSEPTIPNPMFAKSLELGDRVSPYLAGTNPLRWAAVHFSELARDRHLTDESERWKKALYPVHGAYATLLRARLPAGIVTDSQLEEGRLGGYSVLFLPAPDALTDRMKEAVAEFQSRGGRVIEQRASWRWYAPGGGLEQAGRELLAALKERTADALVAVSGGPAKMHAVSFEQKESGRLTVCLCNDFSWVYTGYEPDEESRKKLPGPPLACTGVKIVLRTPEAPGRVFDAVTGSELSVAETKSGFEISVPDFDILAVIVAEAAR